jgi:hypothetical protein
VEYKVEHRSGSALINKLDQEPTPERNRGAFEEPKRFGRGRTSERSSNW